MKALSRFVVFWIILSGLPWAAFAQEEWPQVIQTPEARLVIYQPHPESLTGDSIAARAAVSVTWAGEETPVFGAVWLEARMRVDRNTRLCSFDRVRMPVIKFPDADGADTERVRRLLETELPRLDLNLSLDRILASLEMSEEERALAGEYLTEPPEIIYRSWPAILVSIDGEPHLQSIENGRFERVLNTPFFIVRYTKDRRYYLYGNGQWFSSPELMQGWSEEIDVPSAVGRLGRKLARDAWPDEPVRTDDLIGGAPAGAVEGPEILIRTQPAELIVTTGEPAFTPIQGTGLLYVSNTESQLFLHIARQTYYVVLSGRWYRAPRLEGPWAFMASDALPSDFADIPEGSEKDIVLAYVAGTRAAREALIDAQVPQTARVDRRNTDTRVVYDGSPQFEPIAGTGLAYAVNTGSTVLRTDDGRYYCVDNGIWFEAFGPDGPWRVAVERPVAVTRIPPRYPVYHVKYVYIYDVTPDWVFVGYTPGYVGCYVYGPTIIYGTGYRYRAWYRAYYFPRPWTWGFHMQYNPWWGWSLGFSWIWGDPYTWYYPPYWGQPHPDWWISGGWWGPTYFRPPIYLERHTYYGPRPEESREVRPRPANVYERYPAREVRPDRLPAIDTRYPDRTRQTVPGRSEPAQRQPAPQAEPRERPRNDVYTDPQGNIYRRDPNGEWSRRQQGEWKRVPAEQQRAQPQLEKYNTERQRGEQRTETSRSYRREPAQPAPKAKPRSNRNNE